MNAFNEAGAIGRYEINESAVSQMPQQSQRTSIQSDEYIWNFWNFFRILVLLNHYFDRLPEQKKLSLNTQLRKEVNHLLGQKPDLKLMVTADGAKDNWTYPKASTPMLKCSIFGMP